MTKSICRRNGGIQADAVRRMVGGLQAAAARRRVGGVRACVAFLVTAALIFTNGVAFSYAADSGTSGTNTATALLSAMGVISADSSGSYNLSGTVTRAEFAKMAVIASAYKDLVQTTSYSSPFRDVPAKHWAAPYIRIAVSKGLMSGYSDGTFRPDSPISLEQGVNTTLKLLGYSQSDFAGAFPYAQMNIYGNNGLSQNIAGGIGTLMTRGDAANLIYNLMGTTMKDGSGAYAESLGYSLNDSGEVNYAEIISDNMNGPYTVKSSAWAGELGLTASSLTIYKNGAVVSASDVEPYDILYYSQSKETVWVYDDKVTGIYEKASPSQNAATSVTVSGTEYKLESTAAFSALSSAGTLKIGSAVTLLLGRNGGVADAVSSTAVNEPVVVYVTETGTKTYENSDGSEYTSFYFKGVKPNGSEIEYAAGQDTIKPGDMIKISFDSNGKMSVGTAKSGSNITGAVDADLSLIGSTSIAPNADILDTSLGNSAVTSLQRLDGVRIQSGEVLYYEASGGKVTSLVLKDVTGDTAKYGVVTYAKSNESSTSISGRYEYMIEGVTYTLTTSDRSLNASMGPAKFYGESGKIDSIQKLSFVDKVKNFDSAHVTSGGDIATYPVSANVEVYSGSSGNYQLSTMDAALAAYQAKKSVSFYYDKDPKRGGCIRIIVHQ
ncbi:MAG TPA: S-layer homology domain-containing protein [Anaerovoracaceae bacterium]|nr:S-layer homology domain-containing protein [Anaerovoracaceae bacterium]